MIVQRTAEAKLMSTAASHRGNDPAEIASLDGAVDSVHAFGCRAPS